MTVSNMIHRADEAMYQVKNNGKGYFKIAGGLA
jgi:PleD family two-component response regulator